MSSENIKFSPEDMEAITKGFSNNNNDLWTPLFLLLTLQLFGGSKEDDINSRISNLEGRLDIIEKIVTK